MKKVMKFVKGKREEETPVKNVPIEYKKVVNEKIDETTREDDFISRDKSITKLHKAVWNENSDKLKSIIKTHDIDITDKLDRTALYFAVLKNNPNIVNLLLENSANQNIPDIDGITPFLKSVQLGYKQCAANLLSHGVDIKKTDKDLNSCLHFAVMGKQSDMLSFLLEHNADSNIPNVNGEYPLHIAVQLQDKQIVELLLNHNSDINVVNNTGLTPLMLAEQQNNPDIIELLENCSLKNYKDNNLFPDEISHKSSYENVNTPKIDPEHSPKAESETDTWNDSPLTTPSKKYEKPVTKISKYFNDEIEITEEKSESDVSVKCSENTSPQSGIIPPPCKPLRSLEYLQSGMVMENRPVHLLTLGTVRTRHISMTESDHSKNNTPHRYSYQGDFQAATGDSFQKLPDHFSAADEKGDSVNISIKSKLLSKLECDSTIQSDWGSNESLPLDELSVGGKKEKSTTSSTSKNNSTNSNSGSIRDKSTDIFLQKQFSLLEDYEKNRDKRCSVSYEMDLLTVKQDKSKDNSDRKLDDIENLLEDNNRINTQLEKYAGQTDTPVGISKSKSLPRNCEPYNNYHKGSFSLPRTLESGKDPFREMRSYGYFKPRSHFSFSLKMLRGDKKTGFIDKLKGMFNKKSQIHLQEQNENGTWLYKKTDNEYYSSKVDSSFSGSESSKKGDNLPTSKTLNDLKDFDDDSLSNDPSFSNNEQNKIIENKILSLNNMSRDSSQTGQSSKYSNESCPCLRAEESKIKPIPKSLFSLVKKSGPIPPDDSIFCEECSDFVNQKLNEAEQSLLSKENFINLLQEQLEQLKDRNIKSINDAQDVYYKYSIAQQELLNLKHICAKYDSELQQLRTEKSVATEYDQLATKLKEEAERWKKQYEELMTKVNLEGSTLRTEETEEKTTKTITDEEKWRTIIQNEVTIAVNMLKENSQVVISSLEKQNKMLEIMIEKLQKEVDSATNREEELQKEMHIMKEKLSNASQDSEKIKNKYDEKYKQTINALMINNENLKADLEKITKLYADLQKDCNEKVKIIESDLRSSSENIEELNSVKDEYRALTRSLSGFSEEIVKAKENALVKNEELRQQVAEMGPSTNMKEFINKITESLESIEMACSCKPDNLTDVSEQVTELSNSIADVEKINKLNSDIELKLLEVKTNKTVNSLQEENKTLREEMLKKCENLISKSGEEVELMSNELKSKKEVIKNQTLQIANLNDLIDNEKQKNEMLECELSCAKYEIKTEKTSNIKLSSQNKELQDQLESFLIEKQSVEDENISIKASFSEMENKNTNLNKKLKDAFKTIDEMKVATEESQNRIKKLENTNQELKDSVESIKKAESIITKESGGKINNLLEENKLLKQQLVKEKESITTMKKHIESLQFYHENEMKTNKVKLDELQTESNINKRKFEVEINKLTNTNKFLQGKVDTIEEENKQLHSNISELNQEISALGNKLQNTDILQDPKKYIDALDAINQENIEMKKAMNVLREILEVKLGEKVNSVHDLLEYKSDKKNSSITSKDTVKSGYESSSQKSSVMSNKEKGEIVPTSSNSSKKVVFCKDFCGVNECNKAVLVKRVSSIEKKIDEIVEDVSFKTEDIKSASMPNLEEIENDNTETSELMEYVQSEPNSVVRKSSSLDCIIVKAEKTNVKDNCQSRWERHIESINRLRDELNDILEKIDDGSSVKTPKESCRTKYTAKYKEVITSLQRQLTELQVKSAKESSKTLCLQEDMKGLKGEMSYKTQMEAEMYKLRKELYKQKIERIKDIEISKIKKEAEILALQQHLRAQYLENKQKLLMELNTVQNAIQVKNVEENKIKKKCDELVKEVTASQEVRKKKLQDISQITAQPIAGTVKKIVIYDVPDASQQACDPQCSGYPEKPVKPHALVINARKKLSSLEKHRVSKESVPESTSDEELKKKYLLK